VEAVRLFFLETKEASTDRGTADPLLSIDLRAFLESSTLHLPWTDSRSAKKRDAPPPSSASNTPDASPNPQLTNGSTTQPHAYQDERAAARRLIGVLATWGVDGEVDELLGQLAIERTGGEMGVAVERCALSRYPLRSKRD
jgi:hypothetical protein